MDGTPLAYRIADESAGFLAGRHPSHRFVYIQSSRTMDVEPIGADL